MKKTVTGVFDAPDSAHCAEESLINCGIDQSALHIDTHEIACAGVAGLHPHGVTAGIRNLMAELLGTPHPDEAAAGSDSVRHSEIVLAVDVEDGIPLKPVSQALLEAGARNIHERIES